MLKTNLKIAFRKLVKKREFTVINVFGLAIGLITGLLIFLWVSDELNYDRFHHNAERTYGVWTNDFYENGEVATESNQNGIIKEVLDKDFPEVEKALRVNNREHQLSVGNKQFKNWGLMTDEEFFQVFNFPFIQGELSENSLATDGDIILTETMARKLFGKTNVVGELVRIDNSREAIVRGVVADPPKNSRFDFEFVISVKGWLKRNQWAKRWGNSAMRTYVQLTENASKEELESKIEGLIRENQEGNGKLLFLKPFEDIYLYGNYENGKQSGGRIEYVRLFSIIGIFIVFIACINFINLSVADAFKRAKEVGVRKVTGATKLTLIKQFLVESGLIVLVALVVAIVVVELFITPFNTLTGKHIDLDWFSQETVLLLGALIAFTILVSGLYPALVLSGFNVVKALKGKVDSKGTTRTGGWLRKGLVVFQFVLAGFLIFATIIINNQVNFIFENQNNVDKEGVILLNNDDELLKKYDSFKAELLKDPAIKSVTVVGDAPVNIGSSTGDLTWEGKNPQKDKTSFKLLFTDEGFIPTMKLDLVTGENFPEEESDKGIIILNEAAIRGMNLENPVGKPVKFWGFETKIRGVVKDFHIGSVYSQIEPLIILNVPDNSDYVTIRTAPGKEQRAIQTLQEKYAEFMPGYVFDYKFLEDEHAEMYKSELLIKDLVKIFGGIAILISCLGLFGLTSINAQRSIKEIGIRKVLGASIGQILLDFSRRSLVLPFIALIIMVPLSYYFMNEWLQGFQYHIEVSLVNLAVVVIASLIIAWLTVSVIAFRAARINPINSLRNE